MTDQIVKAIKKCMWLCVAKLNYYQKVLIYAVKEVFYTQNKFAHVFQWLESNTDYILIIFR